MPAAAPDLSEARAALAGGEWERARELLTRAVADDAGAEAWEALGWAAWWLAEEELTFEARGRAYRLYRAADDDRGAARVATWTAADFREYRGEDAVGRGWLERAHRLLDPLPESPDHGWLLLIDADFALNLERDLDTVVGLAERASALGHRHRVPDLETVGLAMSGQALVCRGEVEEGMRRLEEASAIATVEEMWLPVSAGWALCCVLSACEGIGDFGRARQWCEAIEKFTERWGGRQLVGICRTSYGRILATRGEWEEAEGELLAAVDQIESSRPGMASSGFTRLAELRARQGRSDEAQALFARAGTAGLVGLGELALERGEAREAVDAAERVLRRVPESSMLDRLPALELLARARLAAGEDEEAAACGREVARIAAAIATPYVRGHASLLEAELAAAGEDHDRCRRACEDAIDHFDEAAALYDVARARLELGAALLRLGREEQGREQVRGAQRALQPLGAVVDLTRAEALLSGGGGTAAPGSAPLSELTPRELEVLRLVAQGLSDAQIAERLVVSPHTVHRHVANVRTKLRLPSRSAAVAYASREGLL